MMSFVYSIGTFLAIFVLHVFIHRFLRWRGIVTMKSMAIYGIGLVALVYYWKWNILVYPFSSVVLYILLLFVVAPLYMAFTSGSETPAAMLLKAFSRKKTRTFRELSELFTQKGLLWDRIETLQSAGFVLRKGDRYIVTPLGQCVAYMISLYRVLFRRPLGG